MFVQKATIIGAKQFKGNIEGRDFDTCKVRVLMEVPTDAENECGLNVTELSYGKSSNYLGLRQYKFPMDCELELEMELKSGKPVLNLKNLIIKGKPEIKDTLK